MTKKSIRSTQTEKNLLAAFAGESQARNRYTFFASVAREEGYEIVAKFFEETARNEEQHAKQFFKFLEGGDLDFCGSYPAGVISNTLANLKAAAEGEYEEWDNLYPEFAQVAADEGFTAISLKFHQIAAIEKRHEKRYRELLETLKKGQIFAKTEKQEWVCSKCGHVHYDLQAPEVCPVCAHPKAYFEIENDKF